MSSDIRFTVANTPGATARAARAVADAGINIGGFSGDIRPGERWGYIHFQVDDAEAAARALEESGHEVLDIHEVELIAGDDRPGTLAEICQAYADRGENIEVLYLGNNNVIVVGTESMRRPFAGRRIDETRYSERPLG